MIIMYVLFGVSILIGLWALLCLISALIKSGGPVNLIKGWLRAVRGE